MGLTGRTGAGSHNRAPQPGSRVSAWRLGEAGMWDRGGGRGRVPGRPDHTQGGSASGLPCRHRPEACCHWREWPQVIFLTATLLHLQMYICEGSRLMCVLTPVFKFCPHRFSSGSLRKKYMLRTKCSSRAVFKNCDAPLLPFFSLWIRICLLLWPLTPLCVCSLSVFCELCVVCLSRLYCVYTCHVRVCLVAHVVFVSCWSCVPVMCTCG